MIRFLRLFTAFRELEMSLQRERDKRDAAEDRCAGLYVEVARLNAALIEENHKFTDTMALHAIGKRIHSKADSVAPDHPQNTAPLGSGRMHARAAIQRQNANVHAELEQLYRATQAPNVPTA